VNPYETEKLLNEYLLFHYGTAEQVLGDGPGPREALHFAARAVDELLKLPCGPRALDVGCAVGRSSFELARHCETVLGIDFSQAFVGAAERMRAGRATVEQVVEGEITRRAELQRPDVESRRLSFEVGDAMNLRDGLGAFDVVLAANLICRLPEPMKFLERLPGLVKSGGQLLLTTPFTWLEEFTPRENWLGGRSDGKRSFAALQEILAPDFDLQLTKDLPFLIREHERKFQYGIALGSRWIRK
jgi:putative 4-mercaptohistidine N1-methyltranferase